MSTSDDTPILSGFKRCRRCKTVKPATREHFYAHKGYPDGLRAQCKTCVDTANSHYRTTHPDQEKERRRAWNEANVEKRKEQQRAWRAAHPDKTRQYSRSARPRRLDKIRAYRLAHVEKLTAYYHTRRARKQNLPSTFTDADWLRALDYFGHRCAVCNRPAGLWHTLAQDHWIPVSKGGGYTPDNIVPLCHGMDGCNNSKGDKLPEVWLSTRYQEREAREISERISAYFAQVTS